MKKKTFIFVLIIGFIFMNIFTNIFIREYTKSFKVITIQEEFKDTILYTIANTGYSYIWTKRGKFLIPPSEDDNLNYLSLNLQKGDVLHKKKGTLEIFLLRKDKKYQFHIEPQD